MQEESHLRPGMARSPSDWYYHLGTACRRTDEIQRGHRRPDAEDAITGAPGAAIRPAKDFSMVTLGTGPSPWTAAIQ